MWMNGENSSIYFWLWLGDIIAFLRMDSVYYRFRNKIKSLFTAAFSASATRSTGNPFAPSECRYQLFLSGKIYSPPLSFYSTDLSVVFAAFVNRHSERERNVKALTLASFLDNLPLLYFVHTRLLSWIV